MTVVLHTVHSDYEDESQIFKSSSCVVPSVQKRSYVSRFLAKIGVADGCWTWEAGKTASGYGKYRGDLAHRVSYRLFVAPIPPGLFVLHRCDNPECTRPGHLFTGTAADNAQDMYDKGRQSRGEGRPRAKLTAANVLEIRGLLERGVSQVQIANRFGVHASTVNHIARGRAWRHARNENIG
jgi:predicted XRE-type DNA-binding protein